MRKYEGLFILPPDEGPEAVKEGDKRLDEIVSRFGGRTTEKNDWGRRPVGYTVGKFREGHIIVWHFEMAADRLTEFRKALEMDERILKSTIVKQEPVKPPKPSKPRKPSKAPQGIAPRENPRGNYGRESK